MTARLSMASSPSPAFKAVKPEIPYVVGLDLIITAHYPPLPEPKSISHTLRTLKERLVATPLERCMKDFPAEGIPYCTIPLVPFVPKDELFATSKISLVITADHLIASEQENLQNYSFVLEKPLFQTGNRKATQTLEPTNQLAGISATHSTQGATSHAAAQHSHTFTSCHIALKITSQVRVRDGGNAQVVLACITSIEGKPRCQWQLPVGNKIEVVAKFYDPLYADHEHPEQDPFTATDNDYRTEVATYHRLQALQGTIIPRFYGSYTVDLPVVPESLPSVVQEATPTPAITSGKSRKKGSKKLLAPQLQSETASSSVLRTRPVRLILLQEIVNADHLTGIMQPKALRMPRRRLILSSVLTSWETMYYNYGLYYRSLHPTNVLLAEGQGEGVQLMTPRKKKKSKSGGGVPTGIVIIDFTNVSLGPTWPLWRFGRDESWWKEFFADWNWLWMGDWPWNEWMLSRYGDVPIEDRKIGEWVPIHSSEKVTDSNAKETPLITKDSLRGRGSSSSYGRPSIDADGSEISFTTSRDTTVIPSIDATVLGVDQEGGVELETNALTPSKVARTKPNDRHRRGSRFVKSPKDSKMSKETRKRQIGKSAPSLGAIKAVEGADADGDLTMVDAAETWGRSSDEDHEDIIDDEDENDIESTRPKNQ